MAQMGTSQGGGDAIEAERAKANFIFTEACAPGISVNMDLKNILHSTHSPYQKIDVIETCYGKTLITDGKSQSAQFDEHIYHESLVHPSLLKSALLSDDTTVSTPRSVFIGGGGELATAREVLRHKSVERVLMVDLDVKVVEVSRKYLPEWGGEEVMSNSRFELIVGDAYAHLMETSETFDVVIMDISDPIEAGPGICLYTKEFYEHVITRLAPGGVFVTQAGCADSTHDPELKMEVTQCFGPINNTLGSVFDCVVPYATSIPSFVSKWGFVMAFNTPTKGASGDELVRDWCNGPPQLIDELIAARITHQDGDSLEHYDGTTHRHMFALPKSIRKALKRDTRIMTKSNPIFMY